MPQWQLNTITQYTLPIGFYLRGEFFAAGETYFDAANTVRQDPYQVYNSRIGFQRDNYDFYIFGENLSNEQYFLDAFDIGGEIFAGPVGKGRLIGGGISLRF